MQKKLLPITLHTLRILLGASFLFSGFVKLYPIEPFEFNFVDQGFANWYTAPFMARFIISFEFLLGLLLVLNYNLKRFTLKATIGLLIFFTLYLIFGIIKDGNTGNCGCFGTFLKMTPLESIIKNIFLLSIAFTLYFLHNDYDWKYKRAVFISSLLVSLATPMILNPIDLFMSRTQQTEKVGYKIDLDMLYNNPKYSPPTVDLREGKQIVAFFSVTCKHCRIGAFKLGILKKQHPNMPVHVILMGDTAYLKSYYRETKSEMLPISFYNDEKIFKVIGPGVPVVFVLDNGIVKSKMFGLIRDDDKELNALLD